MLGDLKTDAFERYHHTYPASYLWVFIDGTVRLFGSSRSTDTYLRGEELRFEYRVTTVRQNSSKLNIMKLKWHGCINKIRFFISFAFVNTIGLGLGLV